MRAEKNEIGIVFAYRLIESADISGDIDASKSGILPLKKMIVKDRMKRIAEKEGYPFITFCPLASAELFVALLELVVEFYLHEEG